MCLLKKAIDKTKEVSWDYLKNSLKKYFQENQIQLEIESEADIIFLEFKSNKLYRYINDVREEIYDQIIEYTIDNHTINIKPKLDELYRGKKVGKKKYEVVLAFFERLSKIIVDIQAQHVTSELKVVIKANEKNIKDSEQRIISEIADVKFAISNSSDSSKDEKKDYERIGILSLDFKDKKDDTRIRSIIELNENGLNLSCDFSDFYTNYENISWSNILEKINSFIKSQFKGIKDYLLLISANYSVAYAFGKQLGIKGSNIAVINNMQIWDKQNYKPTTINLHRKEEMSENPEVLNLIVSMGMVDIATEVKELYYNQSEYWMSLYFDKFLDSNNEFWSLARLINNSVADIVRNKKIKLINLYFKGAAELLFALGQFSNNWCECQIKEYNFLEKDNSKRKYFNGIKI